MIYLKIPLICFGAWLWYKGGQKNAWMRDALIPAILASWFALTINYRFFLMGAPINIIRLGYGNYEDNEKNSFLAQLWAKLGIRDRQGAIIRATWGFIVSLTIGLPLILTGHLIFKFYLLYILINSLINFLVSKLRLPVLLTDLLVGSGIMSIVIFAK